MLNSPSGRVDEEEESKLESSGQGRLGINVIMVSSRLTERRRIDVQFECGQINK
jgi:hypothetical protein